MSGGSFIGALCAGFIADKWGRRYALMGASIIWIIGAAVQCSSQNVGHLIAGRIISGLSIGITSSQVCVYLAELAPSRIRGRIVGIQQWAIEWGILIMFLVAWGCTTVSGPSAFRIAWGVQAVPGLILFVALLFFPESPRWLAGQERWEECLQVLAAINAKGDQNDPLVQAEYMEVQEAVRIMQESKGVGMIELFGPKIWKRTMCGCSVQMWQQLVGGNGKHTNNDSDQTLRYLANIHSFAVMMYYVVYGKSLSGIASTIVFTEHLLTCAILTTVFSMAGLTGNTTLYSSAIQYVIFLVTTGIILPYIDRVGRRTLLLIGAVSSLILHFTIAGVMATQGHGVDSVEGNTNLKWEVSGASGKAVIALSYIFVGVYGFTWAPVGWIYCSEVFPLKYRAKGVGKRPQNPI
jgi:MFS family permease